MEYNYEKEKQEAIEAGKRALDSLYTAKQDLDSARTWGFIDMFSRGGIISYLVKRNRINNAKQDLENAKYNLKQFSKELNDLSIERELTINEDSFLNFADWFFDNFFVDWMVQEKIDEAKYQVENAINKVNSALQRIS